MTEKIITKAKQNDLHSKRQVYSYVTKETVAKKVFDDIAPKYAERNGGYCRIIKIGPRRGDAAEMAFIELVDFDENMAKTPKAAAKKTRRSRKAAPKAEAPVEAPAAEEAKAE